VHLYVAHTGFPASRGKLPVKIPRLIWSAIHRREEPILLPGLVSPDAIGGLMLDVELEGGYAFIRQWQNSGRTRRLGLAVMKAS